MTIKLLFAGDFAPTIQYQAKLNPSLFDNFPIAKEHDYAILNLEGPLTNINQPIKKMGPNLSINPGWASVIREGGFNIVSLANNHILDMGEAGLLETLDHCENERLEHVGAGKNLQESVKPLIIEKDGIKVGILAFAEKEFSIATENTAGAAPIDSVDNYYAIKALKQKLDHVVLILHAGNEYYPYPRPGLVKLCRYYIDLGASAIICHHAHVPVGYEFYHGNPIFYGTGNFYFPWSEEKPKDWYHGYMVSLNISNTNNIFQKIIPCYFDNNGIYLHENIQEGKAVCEINKRSKTIQDQAELNKNWDIFCKKNKYNYLTTLLANNRFVRGLFKLRLLRYRYFQKKLYLLLNYVICDSHRELLIDIIKLSLKD